MSDQNASEEQAIFLDIEADDGVIATHPELIEFTNRVATSQKGDSTHNTVKPFLIVIGCRLVPNGHFAFDSSIITPDAKKGMSSLARLFDALTDDTIEADSDFEKTPPLSLFGHADPVGNDQYNSQLSARRVRAVYGMLIRDTKIWEDLFTHPLGGDNWGTKSIEIMRDHTEPLPEDASDSVIKNRKEENNKIAHNSGLRQQLFLKYMDAICVRVISGKELQFKLQKENFIARGADPQAKADMQGCGEFNPTLLLSNQKLKAFEKANDKAGRDAANEGNRRVLVFLFKPGSRVDPKKWPCPQVKDQNAVNVCTKRFWSDGEKRRKSAEEEDREFKKTEDTFACRFYHGIAKNSPCEGIHKQWVVRILQDVPREDQDPVKPPRPLANKRFLVEMSDVPEAPRIHGRTDSDGILRLPVIDEITTMKLRLDVGEVLLPKGVKPAQGEKKEEKITDPPKDADKFMVFTLKAGDLKKVDQGTEEEKRLGVKQRLYNLGYGKDKIEEWDDAIFTQAVKSFQKHHKLAKQDGNVDDETRAKLKEVHEPLPTPTTEA